MTYRFIRSLPRQVLSAVCTRVSTRPSRSRVEAGSTNARCASRGTVTACPRVTLKRQREHTDLPYRRSRGDAWLKRDSNNADNRRHQGCLRIARGTLRSWNALHVKPGGSRSSLALSRAFSKEAEEPSASSSSAAAASQVLRSSTALPKPVQHALST